MEGFKIKRIVGLQEDDQKIKKDDTFYMECPEWASPWDYNDKVIMDSKYYEELAVKKEFDGKQSHRAVIAVKYNDRKIYRMFYPQSLGDNYIGLTQTSIQELGILKRDKYKEISVELIKQKRVLSKFMYLYHNPFHEIRIAFKLTIFAIILALIAFIPTIVQLLQCEPK